MLILDLLGMPFHAAVVPVPGKDFLFKSILTRCAHEAIDEAMAFIWSNECGFGGTKGQSWKLEKVHYIK